MLVDSLKTRALGTHVLEVEAHAISELAQRVNDTFVSACQMIYACKGRVVVTGMGKSGHIGKKIAATMASTGTPALFLHPAEALHGDLGMMTKQDIALILSYSGETEEILRILPLIKRLGLPILALTGNPLSTLAKLVDIHLDVSVRQEACPLGLAPTASTTAALAMGDALALAVLQARGFTAEDFAKSHPAGRLGKRLLLKIEDIMHKNESIPRVSQDVCIADAVIEMTQKRMGFTTIVDSTHPEILCGMFTDGDLRRTFLDGLNIHHTPITHVMTRNYTCITADALAHEAAHLMESIQSFMLPVLDHQARLVGVIHMHDLLQAGII